MLSNRLSPQDLKPLIGRYPVTDCMRYSPTLTHYLSYFGLGVALPLVAALVQYATVLEIPMAAWFPIVVVALSSIVLGCTLIEWRVKTYAIGEVAIDDKSIVTLDRNGKEIGTAEMDRICKIRKVQADWPLSRGKRRIVLVEVSDSECPGLSTDGVWFPAAMPFTSKLIGLAAARGVPVVVDHDVDMG